MIRTMKHLLIALCCLPLWASSLSAREDLDIHWNDDACFVQGSQRFRVLRPNARHCHRQLVRGSQVLLDTEVNTDEYARRVVPQSTKNGRKGFVAFLGCSYTFGSGVLDSETTAARVAEKNPGWQVFNYGNPAFGPGNVLRKLETTHLKAELPNLPAKFVYTWIPDHAVRVYGAVSHPFTDDYPNYELNAAGKPIFKGSLAENHPFRYWVYRQLRRGGFAERLGFDLPPYISESDFDLIVSMFRKMKAITSREFPGSTFYLVLWPSGDSRLARRADKIFTQAFADGSIRVLNYDAPGISFPGWAPNLPDGHPSAPQYAAIARKLSPDIGLK